MQCKHPPTPHLEEPLVVVNHSVNTGTLILRVGKGDLWWVYVCRCMHMYVCVCVCICVCVWGGGMRVCVVYCNLGKFRC